MPVLEPGLDHPAYHARVKLRYYNYAVSIFQATSDQDAARILQRLHPEWTTADHEELATRHREAADRQAAAWSRLVEAAAQETFGRPYQFTDYRISGIACDEFSDVNKDKLRFAAHAATYHSLASRAHGVAAKMRSTRRIGVAH